LRLHCQKAALLVAVATIACTDPSEPSAISAHFVLTDVDGRALPATAGTTGQTLVSGTLSLDQAGGAIISEDRIDSDGVQHSFQAGYTYTIKNSTITFEYVSCPINANCAPPPTGQILDNGLHVQVSYPPVYLFQVYNYRVSATP
jgi:hypothetical protein